MKPSCVVSLHDRQWGNIGANLAQRQKFGSTAGDENAFTIADVLPGSYDLRVGCQIGYVVAAVAGGVDLLANPTLSVLPGVAPPPIEIQVKPGGGTLQGEVAVPSLPQTAGVLVVPSFPNSTGPIMVPLGVGPQQKTSFMRPFIRPGDYTLYAFSNWQDVEFRSPAFLQALTGGVSVRVEDGKEQQIYITSVVK